MHTQRGTAITPFRGKAIPRGGRSVATLVSAILSSATNAGAVLVGAALLDAASYGAFSLAALVALLASLVVNSSTGEVLLGIAPKPEDIARAYSATAVLLLLLSGGALIVLATPLGANLTLTTFFSVAAATVATTAHALSRSSAFAGHRPGTAVLLDVVWAVWLIVTVGAAIWFDLPLSADSLLLLWSSGAAVAVIGCPGRENLLSIRPRLAWGWWTHEGRLGLSLAYGAIADSGARNAVIATVAPVSGLAALGGLRFTQTALGLSTVFFSAARSRVLPLLAKRDITDPQVARSLLILSTSLALVPMAAGGFMLLLSPVLDDIVNDQTWRVSRTLILPVTITFAGSALTQGPLIGLRLLGAASRLATVRTVHGIFLLSAGLTLLNLFGVEGAAWGLALANAAGAGIWWGTFMRARRVHKPRETR